MSYKRRDKKEAGTSAPAGAFHIPLESFELPNGLKVYVQEDRSSPTISVSLSYRVGSRNEVRGRSGFAHLFEHLMFEGSENVPAGEFSKYIEANGGADNAYTSLDHTNYHEILPANLIELALWLEADRMRSLVLNTATLEREKRVVQEEIRLRILNKPYIKAIEEDLGKAAYVKWANQHSVAGTLKDVGAAALKEVRQFFKTHYSPNRAVLVLVGDVALPEARRLVEKHFGGIPAKPAPPEPDLQEPELPAEKRLTVLDPLAKLPQAVLVWHMPEKGSRDFWPMALLMEYLTGGEESPLYQALVKSSQVAIDCGGYFPMWSTLYDFKAPDLLAITVLFRPEHGLDRVLLELDNILESVRTKGLGEEDVARIKARLKYSWLTHFQFPFDRAKHFSAYAATQGDPRQLEADFERMLEVSLEDLRETAGRCLRQDRRLVLGILPGAASSGERAAEETERLPALITDEEPGRRIAQELPEPAAVSPRAVPPPVPGPAREVNIPRLSSFRLTNGLEVVVVEDRQFPLLHVRMALPAGSSRARIAGLAEAAADLVMKGTDRESAQQIAEGFSSLGSRLDVQDQPDHLLFHGSLLSESAGPYFTRMAELLTRASFPEEEVRLWVRNMKEELKLRRSDPGFLAEERLDKRLFAGHPYERLSPTIESLPEMSREAVADFFRAHAVPSQSVLVLIGDIRAEDARRTLDRTLGGWTGRATRRPERKAAAPASPTVQLVHREDSQQANVVMRSLMGLRRSDPDFYAFQVMNQILGIGFNSRLNKNLRVKNGYTYGIYSQPELRRLASLFEIATEVESGVVAPALGEILKEVRGLRGGPVTGEEIHRAKKFLAGVFVMRLAHPSRFAGQILGLKLEGIDPQAELESYLGRLEAVAQGDVHFAAHKHLDPDAFQIAVVGNARELAPALKTFGLPLEILDTDGNPLPL